MNSLFLESSSLSKRYTVETGTIWIRTLVSPKIGNRIWVSHLTVLELVSSLARKQREGLIPERTMRAAILLIERHIAREYIVIQFGEAVEGMAKQLLLTHPLRAADAIQLASALVVHRQLPLSETLTFISADRQLLNAAMKEGLPVDNPILHP